MSLEVELTDANFEAEVLKSEMPVLVDFWATWCGPCKAIAPIIADLAKAYQGKIKVGKVDVDKHAATAGKYRIMSIPSLLIFKNGAVVEQIVGARPKTSIEASLKKVL